MQATQQTEKLSRNKAIALIYLALFFASIIYGLPLPFTDDMFYIGPAIGLEQTGQVINPFIPFQFEEVKNFYIYPVYYFVIYSFAFKLFGVGKFLLITLHVFQVLLSAFLLTKLVNRYSNNYSWLSYFIPFLILFSFSYHGFRPELTAFTTLLLGLFLFSKELMNRFTSIFLISGSVLIAPAVLPFSAVALFFIFLDDWKSTLKLFSASALIHTLLTGFFISFDYLELFHGIMLHSERISSLHWTLKWQVIFTAVILLASIIFDTYNNRGLDKIKLALFIILILSTALHPKYMLIHPLIFLSLAIALGNNSKIFSKVLLSTSLGCFLFFSHVNLLQYLLLSKSVSPPFSLPIAVKNHLENGKRVFTDEYGFRELIGENIMFYDWSFQKPFPKSRPKSVLDKLDTEDVWILNQFNKEYRFQEYRNREHYLPVFMKPITRNLHKYRQNVFPKIKNAYDEL